MASFFKSIGKLFGASDDKPAEYDKTKPFMSLREIPETTQYYLPTLEERLAGKNVGYSQSVLDSSTAPFATARRAAVADYEAPAITGAASARGLGRSSLVTSQIGKAQQQASQDIEQRMADIALRNEAQKRQEINQALSDIGQWTLNESNQRTTRAGFDYADWNRINNEQNANEQAQKQGAMRSLMLGAAVAAAPFTGGASLAAVPMIMSSGTGQPMSNNDSSALIQKILQSRGVGQTSISGISNISGNQFAMQGLPSLGGF